MGHFIGNLGVFYKIRKKYFKTILQDAKERGNICIFEIA